MSKKSTDIITQITGFLNTAQEWATGFFYSADTVYQATAFMVALLAAKIMARPIVKGINYLSEQVSTRWLSSFVARLDSIAYPLSALIILWLLTAAFGIIGKPAEILRVAANLFGVWVAIRFTATFVENRTVARWISVFVWSIAALNILGLLEPTLTQMDAIGFSLGKTRLSLLVVFKGLLAFAGFLWLATLLARVSERRIQSITTLTPSLRVLIVKITRTMLIILAFIIGLNTLGIDLTSLAVFSGAIGVGIGFGLQKVVSNFISGIILLLDRSIKPGDVIYISDTDTYGWVNALGARCVSVVTRDGKEHLIPNELLITEKVENWSYSNRDVRIKIPVGISYESDPRKALELMMEVAAENPRILKNPSPNALLRNFGDSSVNLELRAWIDDPANGIGNIISSISLDIWDKFHANGVAFPFPQRDLHIREDSVITVKQAKGK